MSRSSLTLAAIILVATPLFAEDKKSEKTDPAKLVGQWRSKKLVDLPIDIVTVFDFGAGGNVGVGTAQPADLTYVDVWAKGTYSACGTKLELKLRSTKWNNGKVRATTGEIVKLTDTEFDLKTHDEEESGSDEVTEFVRVTADDLDTTVDTARLVGKWRMKAWSPVDPKEPVGITEFVKGGGLVMSVAPPGDLTKAEKKSDGTYKLMDKTLEMTKDATGDQKAETKVFEIVKLTATKLTIRNVQEKDDEKGIAFAFERVKEGKK